MIVRSFRRFHFLSGLRHSMPRVREEPAVVERNIGVPVHEGPSTSFPEAGERQIPTHIQQLVERIASLSLLEAADLNYALKKRLNIPDQPMMGSQMMMPMATMAGVATAGGGGGQQQTEQLEEEDDVTPTKISYSVKLENFDESKKIGLIKEVRACIPGMNLVQAKKLIDTVPIQIKSDIGMAEAEELKAKLEAQGAECKIE